MSKFRPIWSHWTSPITLFGQRFRLAGKNAYLNTLLILRTLFNVLGGQLNVSRRTISQFLGTFSIEVYLDNISAWLASL